jgi:hypothetical protein
VPITVVLAFVFVGGLRGSSPDTTAPVTTQPSVLPPTAVSPPPDNPAVQSACTKLLAALPTRLAGLDPRRIVPPASPFVLAWGDPAVVLRCGVARPAGLVPAGTVQVFNASSVGRPAVYWLPVNQPKQNIFTTVDRGVYVEVTVPTGYRQPPLAPLSDAIASVLPAVCTVPEPGQPAPPPASLCTHRR